jgi:hypothetical protein
MAKHFFKLLIFFFIFFGGYYFHKYHPFPHQYLLKFKNYILDYKNVKIDKFFREKYPNWQEKNENLHLIHITAYKKDINIFSDRSFFNHLNDDFLSEYFLVQLPRHNQEVKKFELNFYEDVIVLRILCERNNNKYYNNWEKIKTKVAIIGYSCIHTDIAKKKFTKGKYIFSLDGPVATNPLFFKLIYKSNNKFYQLKE